MMRQSHARHGVGRTLLLATFLLSAPVLTVSAQGEKPLPAPAGAAAPKAAAGDPAACSRTYHASLGRIAKAEYEGVKAARDLVQDGDDRLPGFLLFPPSGMQRTRPEAQALAAANALAKSRGSTSWRRDADGRWISERLRLDLGDYLGQKPSPFLCGGVVVYVETLRNFARRLGPSPAERDASIAAQKVAAETSVRQALLAFRPAPAPRFAPADRPTATLVYGLRLGGSIGREDRATMAKGDQASSDAAGITAGADSDLPPLKAQPVRLESVPDLAAAIDRLVAAAHKAGLVTGTANDMAFGTGLAVTVSSHPVLARLALARPYVSGQRPLITDRVARLDLARAFSDLEALDYLMRAKGAGGDPMANAIDKTFEAILAAHAKDCACGE